MEEYCVGKNRISCGTWYMPNDKKTSTQSKYCDFCVKNGCVPKDSVTKITEKVNGYNCDCPKRDSHPDIISLRCPICCVKMMGMFSCCSCGMCKNCKNSKTCTPSPGYTYCVFCSHELKQCEKCGEKIYPGNYYLPLIREELDKKIKHHSNLLAKEESIKEYETMYKFLLPKYENKTSEEMINLLFLEKKEKQKNLK